MNISTLKYYLVEGVKSLYKNQKSLFGSLLTICATLFIFGVFILISVNTKDFVRSLQLEQGIQVFVTDGLEKEKVTEIESKLIDIKEINTVTFKSKEEAFEDLKKKFQDTPSTLEGLDGTQVLPDSFIIKLTDLSKTKEVISQVEKIENIEKVNDSQEIISIIVGMSNVVNSVTFIITAVLTIVTIIIIANTIKLSVFARRKEIGIMKYVGATNSFIKGPFIVEGIIIGIISSIITFTLVAISYQAIIVKIDGDFTKSVVSNLDSNITLTQLSEVAPMLALTFFAMSIGLGVIGSSISMRKHLDV